MSAQLLGTWPVGSPEWHESRSSALGGSEIAAVLGLSPWESRYSLWLRKAGIVTEPKPLTKPMIVGNYVEAACAKWWHDRNEPQWARFPAHGGTFANTERAWQVSTPDEIVTRSGGYDWEECLKLAPVALLECKFAIYDYEWGVEGTDEIPPQYLAQCRWYLDVFGLDTCYVAVLFGGSGRFAEYVVHPDPADTELMRREAVAFLESVASGERPDIDEHSATYEAIRAEHPDIDREASVELGDLWLKYEFTQHMRDSHTDGYRKAKAEVLDVMGDARIATHLDEPVLRRQPGQGGAVALHPIRTRKETAA